MKSLLFFLFILLLSACTGTAGFQQQNSNAQAVIDTEGLIAFWDFKHMGDSTWDSYQDPQLPLKSFPLQLKRIGDINSYSTETWPYADTPIEFDQSGPFGKAIKLDRGYLYGAVERKAFDKSLLDLHGKKPFTMIAWLKFYGTRHLVAGIWDEGGWNKYAGRRQAALFAGLFRQKGVIAHISATGASSYPQSTIDGAQYARLRAIDGQAFEDEQWIAMAMTFDPDKAEVVAYLNGVMTPLLLSDPVTQDVYQYQEEQVANPFHFPHPIYSPQAFVLKYNGYDLKRDGISEHRLHVDLIDKTLTYEQDPEEAVDSTKLRLFFDIKRQGKSLLAAPLVIEGIHGQSIALPTDLRIHLQDEVSSWLESKRNGNWEQIGTLIAHQLSEGAPFTFGRALGLGTEDIEHGSQLYLDGLAVFNRVLKAEELKGLSFPKEQAFSGRFSGQ